MDVETTDHEELGCVTEDTAGDLDLRIEKSGREDWVGLSAE